MDGKKAWSGVRTHFRTGKQHGSLYSGIRIVDGRSQGLRGETPKQREGNKETTFQFEQGSYLVTATAKPECRTVRVFQKQNTRPPQRARQDT